VIKTIKIIKVLPEKVTEKPHFSYFIPMKQSLSLPSPFFIKSKINCVLKNDVFDDLLIIIQIKTDNTLAMTVYSDDAEPVNAVGAKHKQISEYLTFKY
jgi:hypothetical protein